MIFKLHKIKNKEKIQEEAEQKQKTNKQINKQNPLHL